MLRIHPFAALRPLANRAPQVACPPYDVVSREEAAQIARGNPFSFMRVCRPEVDLPASTDPYNPAVYAKGRENLQTLVTRGVLLRDELPQLYLYRLAMDHRPQIGLVCCCHVDDYSNNVIRRHEKTRPDKEDDRTRHILALNAHAGPVLLAHRDDPAIEELVSRDTNDRPAVHFNAGDGVTHTLWHIRDAQPYVHAFAQMDAMYVADGHHRCASATRAAADRKSANPRHTGDEEYNWFLTVIFPASQLRILPYNRVLTDLHNQTAAQVLQRLEALGKLTTTHDPSPDRPGVFCFYLQGTWRRLELNKRLIDHSDPIRSLDVALLQEHVLEPIFGIADPRTAKHIDFVGGIRGTAELQKRVDEGRAAVAISMYPTTMEQLLKVSDAGQIMPPKSTWFEPKLRSGLFVHTLD